MLSLYISSSTWLHAVPAGLKLTALAAASVLLLPATELGWLFGVCVLSSAGFLSLGAPGKRRLVCLIKTAGVLALMIGVFQFFFSVQDTGYEAAIHAATVSALRLLSLVLLADLVSVTTPMAELLGAIHWLLAPLRLLGVSNKKLELSIGLMIRMATLLNQRREAVAQAIKARTSQCVGLRLIAPLVRQLGPQNRQLAEALYARTLRSQSPNSSDQ
jgi:biotin transport system permease protein